MSAKFALAESPSGVGIIAPITYILASNGDGTWSPVPQGGGGGAVTSVFTRTGAVVAVNGDYNSSQVTNNSSVDGATVTDALQTLRQSAPGETDDGNSGAAPSIDVSQGFSNRLLTINSNTTITLTGEQPGKHYQFRLIQDGVGGHTIAFSDTIVWFGNGGAAPSWNTGVAANNLLNLYCVAANTFWGIGSPGA